MANNMNRDLHLNLPLTARLKLALFSLAKLLYIRRDGTINRQIFSLFDRRTAAPAKKCIDKITVLTSDVTVDPSRDLWFRLFTPEITDPKYAKLPLIVYFHGGGFNILAPNSRNYDQLCSYLAAKIPAVIASVNYRLAPEHHYPCQYEDSFDALKFINGQKSSGLFPPKTNFNKCFIAGDSAGGNIAHHVTIRACKNSQDFEILKIAGVLEFQPFFGGEERTESELRLTKAPVLDVKQTDWMWRLFLPEGADRDHCAVNVLRDPESVKEMEALEFPSVLVIIGGFDPLQDWQRRYVEGMKKCGKEVEVIEYPEAVHGFYAGTELREFSSFLSDVAKFVEKKSADFN